MDILLMGAGAAACLLCFVWGLRMAGSQERIDASAVPAVPKRKDDLFILARVADRVGAPFTGVAMDLLSPWRVKIRKRIDAAGRPRGMTVETYARQTAGYVVIFGGLAVLMLLSGERLLAFVCLLGTLQAEGVLVGRIRRRRDDIERTLPDFLDVLAVTVAAGLSLRHALARVAESMPGALADEFMVALRQMELGTPRREAFEDLRSRNDSDAIGQFVTAILQAEELGTALSTALMDIATDMRRESAQWAKRKAQKTSPKITGITTLLTLPALMMIVIGGLFYGADIQGGLGVFGG
ncbi:type II secretion system F family protein [Actinomadura bangladeshensis]|nr:type II secretion system F family protein [Actinomadura bangladeshensis]